MTLSHESLEVLFRAGRFVELLSKTGRDDTAISVVGSVDYCLTVAEALLHVGESATAVRLAEAYNATTNSSTVRARCEAILGLAARRDGNLAEATRYFQRAVQLAREDKDLRQAGWASLYLFRILAESEPQEVLSGALLKVRKLILQIGDAHLAAYLHESVARAEAQTGNFEEANRHIEISESILRVHPNAWLEQLAAIHRLGVAILTCNPRAARISSKEARRLVRVTGSETGEAAVAIATAHFHLLVGEFEQAFREFSQVRTSGAGITWSAVVEGLARLHLVLNEIDKCEERLKELSKLLRDSGMRGSYANRWGAVTEVKLLMRTGREEAAVDKASDALRSARDVDDRPVINALLLNQARAFRQLGFEAAAGHNVLEVVRRSPLLNREHAGDYYYHCSAIIDGRNPSLELLLTERAVRVWRMSHNVCAIVEAGLKTDEPVDETGLVPVSDSQSRATIAVNSIAAAFDLADEPLLFGRELLRVVVELRCAKRVELRRNGRTIASCEEHPTKQSGELRILLTSGSTEDVALVAIPADDSVSAIVLADIFRIAKGVLDAATARRADRARAALWPAADYEAQSGSVFVSEEMRALLATARRIATTNVPVLITGETGTGKEVLARTIHAHSARSAGAFLPFNCTAFPKDMLDAQLFGHRKGSFTGATDHFPGMIRAAQGGTLFLDEIGEAGLDVQPKLLRFLESGEIHPIGEMHPLNVDVRVIAATNADLDDLVAKGKFREDLFYRLNIVRLHVPPLRERRVEIPALAQHYLQRHAQEFAKGDLRLAEETMEYLLLYRWPGNVRHLANEMRRMAALAESGAVLMPEHLSPDIFASRRTVPTSERPLDPTEVVVRLDQPMAAAVEHLERAMVQRALKVCGGRMEETASLLGLSRKGLYLKRQRFGLEPPAPHQKTA